MTSTSQPPSDLTQGFDPVVGGMQAFAAIGLVLALVIVLAWLVRRGTLRFPGARAAAAIRIESGASLGERRSVVIVNVEGRRLLLGLTPVQVSTLAELGPAPASFSESLDSRLDGRTAAGQS